MKIKVTVSGSPLDIGSVLEVDEIPVWLVNKCVVVDESIIEVATHSVKDEPQKRTYKRRTEAQ